MRAAIKSALVVSLLAMSISACSGGSDQASSDSTAAEVSTTEAPPVEDTDVEETQDTATSGTIATDNIGYGHYMDSGYLEIVQKNMNGNQSNTYSEAQLFNYARNTCTDLRGGNWKKIIKLMQGAKGTTDYSFIASMTMAAIYAYCPESENPFMKEAQKLGL